MAQLSTTALWGFWVIYPHDDTMTWWHDDTASWELLLIPVAQHCEGEPWCTLLTWEKVKIENLQSIFHGLYITFTASWVQSQPQVGTMCILKLHLLVNYWLSVSPTGRRAWRPYCDSRERVKGQQWTSSLQWPQSPSSLVPTRTAGTNKRNMSRRLSRQGIVVLGRCNDGEVGMEPAYYMVFLRASL